MWDAHQIDPTDQWGLIFHSSGLYNRSHSRQEWAQIADAIRTADLLHAARPTAIGDPAVRGDTAWCQIAVDTFTRLDAAGAYWHLRPGDNPQCYADEHLIRAWLQAPWVPAGDLPLTMAEVGGWADYFAPGRATDPATLTILVDLAQDAGVFGAPQHKVSLLRWVQDGITRDDAFLVLLWPPDGPARGSSPVRVDQLVPPGRGPVDTIVGVLRAVATVTNQLIAAPVAEQVHHRPAALKVAPAPAPETAAERVGPVAPVEPPPMPSHVEGWRIGDPARVFPPLRLVPPTAALGDPPPSPPPPPRPRPHR